MSSKETSDPEWPPVSPRGPSLRSEARYTLKWQVLIGFLWSPECGNHTSRCHPKNRYEPTSVISVKTGCSSQRSWIPALKALNAGVSIRGL
jgi:hypothetical protein